MLHKSYLALAIVIALSLNIACSEEVNNSNNSSPISEEQAVQKSQQMVEGTVNKTELTIENGIKVWEVYMTATSGGELKIKYRLDDGTMVEIKGVSASFDYEVQPGMNLVNYSVAKSAALNAKSGEILEWKLEKDESNNRWEYCFKIRSGEQDWEIRLEASSGVVLRIT